MNLFAIWLLWTGVSDCLGYGNVIDDLDAESLKCRYSSRMVGQEPDPFKVQIGKNLGADADFALRFTFALRQRRQPSIPVESQQGLVSHAFNRESL